MTNNPSEVPKAYRQYQNIQKINFVLQNIFSPHESVSCCLCLQFQLLYPSQLYIIVYIMFADNNIINIWMGVTNDHFSFLHSLNFCLSVNMRNCECHNA